jgi:hypothetical protein
MLKDKDVGKPILIFYYFCTWKYVQVTCGKFLCQDWVWIWSIGSGLVQHVQESVTLAVGWGTRRDSPRQPGRGMTRSSLREPTRSILNSFLVFYPCVMNISGANPYLCYNKMIYTAAINAHLEVLDVRSGVWRLQNSQATLFFMFSNQCWGFVTFWCGSESPDPYLLLMDPDPTPFFIDFKDAKKTVFIFF